MLQFFMRAVSNTNVKEVVYSCLKDPDNIGTEKTKKEFEEREVAEALAHIYGYG